jgi:antitoxin component HigA of HigAB toxin-antitoxin module
MARDMAIVLDIDGTIIGNIATQRTIYTLLSGKYEIPKIPLRPHFLEFVKSLPHAELFIYTASVSDWAETLMSYIEKEYGITFNRPLFTRPNTIWTGNEYQKTLKNIMPVIKNTMRNKHKEDFDVLIIDNTNFYAPEDLPFLITCPTYNNTVRADIKKSITASTYLKNKDYMDTILSKSLISEVNPSSYEDFVRMLRNLNSFSFKNKKDTFWKDIGRLLKNKTHIQKIRQELAR